MNNIKKAIQDIYETCEKYSDPAVYGNSIFYSVRDLKEKTKGILKIIEWNDSYGLNISKNTSFSSDRCLKTDEYSSFIYFKDAKSEKDNGVGRYITYEDDDRQPQNEWMLVLSFPTGPYMFGDDCPRDLFKQFWEELKGYGPKYCDTMNTCLYFALDGCSEVYNSFYDILRKYREIYKGQENKRKIEKLEKEIIKLKGNL